MRRNGKNERMTGLMYFLYKQTLSRYLVQEMASFVEQSSPFLPDSGADSAQKIHLIPKEGVVVETTWEVAKHSGFISALLEDEFSGDNRNNGEDSAIPSVPVPNVDSKTLELVLQFMEHHNKQPMSEIEKPLRGAFSEVVQEWYANFCNVDQETLFQLILASNYLDVRPLLNLTCACVASMIKGKTPEEIRQTFGIVNDFTPEEERMVREENRWCEE